MRLAIVGLGGIAQSVHLPLIQRNRADVALVAAVELSAARLATLGDRYAIPVSGRFTSLADLIAAIGAGDVEVDAAIVATGGGHTDEALALVAAGVRVLVEKPLGWSRGELDRLQAGLDAIGRDPRDWLRIGYMKEHDPAVAAAREILADVDPREVRVEVLHPADEAQIRFARLEPAADDVDPATVADLHARSQRAVTEALGVDDDTLRRLWTNVALGSIIHDISLTRHLGLELDQVERAARLGDRFPGSVLATGLTAGGVPWNLGWHFIADYPEYRETVTVHHERGSVELEFATPYILNAPTTLRVRSGGSELSSQVVQRAWPQEEAFERQLHALLALTKGEQAAGSSLPEARRDLTSAWALWSACADHAGLDVEAGRETAPAAEDGAPAVAQTHTERNPR